MKPYPYFQYLATRVQRAASEADTKGLSKSKQILLHWSRTKFRLFTIFVKNQVIDIERVKRIGKYVEVFTVSKGSIKCISLNVP